jgi:protocatechuate 3,4-dioxygenase beta subunit
VKASRIITTTLFALVLCASVCRAQNSSAPVVVQSQTTTAQGGEAQAAQPAVGTREGADKAARAVKGSITGRVVNDAGEPLPGVFVSAAPRAAGASPLPARRASTDEEGNFTLSGLAPGLYALAAYVPGYVPESDPLTGRETQLYKPGDAATVRLVKGGVVTGTVMSTTGEPLVAMSVRAYRVRDLDGQALSSPVPSLGEGRTDDRGVYRIFGLRPGIYVVLAGGYSPSQFGPSSPYGDAPTFYPSSTRDTAAEVTVRGGQESAGVDIRFREDQPSHRVTGKIEAAGAQGDSAVSVSLNYAASSIVVANIFVAPTSTDRSFSFEGVPDGDYDVQASSAAARAGLAATSAPQRVTVRGADVTGLRLTLAPLASASGTLAVEPLTDKERALDACKAVRSSPLPQETLVSALADRPPKAQPLSRFSMLRDTTPDATGAFTIKYLEPGRYHLALRLPGGSLYVRALELPAPSSAPPSADDARAAAQQRANGSATNARELFDIKPGQQLNGINIRLAEGAAMLSGKVTTPDAAPAAFNQLRVYLLPAEREQADNALRFYETTPAADGAFLFRNLAPGRYLALARAVADPTDASPRPAAWDASTRARLRREAESANAAVELQPCQRATDFALRFPPQPK